MNILIIEDEKLTAEDLAESIQAALPQAVIVGVIPSIERALSFFSNKPEIDLIFSDIQLQDGVSFEIFHQIEIRCPIIFCTAFNEYALQAIKANGIDYILKPFASEDVKNALMKYLSWKTMMTGAGEQIEQQLSGLLKTIGGSKKQSLLVHYQGRIIPVSQDDVAIFFKENDVTYLITKQSKKYVYERTLEQLEEELSNRFFRINRQCIIQRDVVVETIQLFNRRLEVLITLTLPFKLEVSRNRVANFLNWLKGE
jgi:two-component system, LytTR family, response regulator LytT